MKKQLMKAVESLHQYLVTNPNLHVRICKYIAIIDESVIIHNRL